MIATIPRPNTIPLGVRFKKTLRATSLRLPSKIKETLQVKSNGEIKLGKPGGIVFEPNPKQVWYPPGFKNFVLPDLKKPSPLADLILRPIDQFISTEELHGVLSNVEFEIFCYETGSIPASTNTGSTYSKFGWARDKANKIETMIEFGNIDEAIAGVRCLGEFYNNRENRGILTSYLWHPDKYETAYERWKTGEGGHPPIRGEIDSEGRLVRSNEPWGNNQIDALGAWLYITFKLANVLNDKNHPRYNPNFLRQLNEHLSTNINDENNLDSIFSVAFKSLHSINCWNNSDLGAWEDVYAWKRTSSIAAVLRAAHEARWYFGQNKWDTMPIHDVGRFKYELDQIIENCTKSKNERIAPDGSYAVETDLFPSDSAQSFLLYPFNTELNEAQERAILKDLYENRMGVIGFTRRPNDVYMGQDYIHYLHLKGINADPYVPDYRAAEWTLFDPNLCIYYLNKAEKQLLENRVVDTAALELSEFHLRRSLAHITKESDRYRKRYHTPEGFKDVIIETKGNRIPEAYWYDSHYEDKLTGEFGRWRANENTPLLWAEANFAKMLKRQLEVKALLESHYLDIWKIAA